MKNLKKVVVACACLCVLCVDGEAKVAQPTSQRSASLGEFSSSVERLTARVSKSVVQIIVSGYGFTNDQGPAGASVLVRQRATGSGAIVSGDGFIMTNAHIVDGARHISVHFNLGSDRPVLLDGALVGLDRSLDLALIKVDASGLQPLEFADSDDLKQGQLVFAFGAPLGLENSVSMGVISSVARQISPDDPRIYVQTDAPINPGNSGGPLVDTDGKVTGLNTFIFTQSGGSEGLGFAIPSNVVSYALNQLRTDGHVHHGQIGLTLRTITEPLAEGLGIQPYTGALIEDINPNSAAASSELKVGDVVVSIGNRLVQSARDFSLGIYKYSIGEFADLTVIRGEESLSVRVEVTEPQDDPQRLADLVDPAKDSIPKLGFLAMEVTRDVKKMLGDLRFDTGILVAARTGTSAYVGEELEQGDIIHSMNGQPVTTLEGFRGALAKIKAGAPIVLQVERDGTLHYLTLESN